MRACQLAHRRLRHQEGLLPRPAARHRRHTIPALGATSAALLAARALSAVAFVAAQLTTALARALSATLALALALALTLAATLASRCRDGG